MGTAIVRWIPRIPPSTVAAPTISLKRRATTSGERVKSELVFAR
jgi:hypothetical protein